ncbi:hypothetical protein K378_00515 [Streptomyces sp. Amel2xB2]|nr:hypothetical protein K378_00515 [Streptomyces sp. Amel2xB2]
MRCRRTSLLAAVVLGCVLAAGGCTSEADLYPKARCGDKALTDTKRDAPKILALAPEGISDVEGRFYENTSTMYQAECYVSDGEGNGFLTGSAVYYSGKENNPGRSPEHFFNEKNFKGTLRKVTSSDDAVAGVSGRGSAGVWGPCSLHESTGFRPGAMIATISASSAPNGGNVKQRQNAADLALSLLRYAMKQCDEPLTLPKGVKVER